MKLRGLGIVNLVLLSVVLFAAFFLYRNSQQIIIPEATKSELTNENLLSKSTKNLRQVIAENLKKQSDYKSDFTERKDFDTSVLTQERFYTEKEILEMTEAQFVELMKEVELKLPKLSEIKKIPAGALHHVPAPVLQAGKEMGLLKEVLKVHESYETVALDFYQRCAKNTESPTSVRALCLTNFVAIKKKNGEKINLTHYPAQLVELTRMITDI